MGEHRLARAVGAAAMACIGSIASPYAQTAALTFEQAIARARAQAPRVVAARARIDEARGRLTGASLRFQQNPVVEGGLGPRHGPAGTSPDVDVSLTHLLEPSSRRSARLAGARAEIDQETAAALDAERLATRDAAMTFLRAVHAGERTRLLAAALQIATETRDVADRNYRAGDVAVLDVNVAAAALARARADVRAAEASRMEAVGELRALLDLARAEEVDIAGVLRHRSGFDLETLLAAARHRADLEALAAQVTSAEADVALGRSFRRPEWGWAARYEREESDRIVLGGLTVTLPVFNRGQELEATGLARAQRLRVELDAARRAVETEVRTTNDVYRTRVSVVEELERNALPHLDENERLARRSFEVGQLRLVDFLVLRREILATRLEFVDAELAASLAAIHQESSAGVLR